MAKICFQLIRGAAIMFALLVGVAADPIPTAWQTSTIVSQAQAVVGRPATPKDRTEFLARELPVGRFEPERRRVAPAKLATDGENARVRNVWLLTAMPCDIETGEALLDRCPACLNLLGWRSLQNVWSCQGT